MPRSPTITIFSRLIFRVGPLDYTWADEVATAIASHPTAST
jgi:hypothetical protein